MRLLTCVMMTVGLSAQEAKPTPAQNEPVSAQKTERKSKAILPGVQASGEILLPNQWSLKPAGRQITVGDFPVNIAVSPDEQFLAVLHAGAGQHEVVVIETKSSRVVSRTIVPQTFYGITFNREGSELYFSGGEYEVIHRFRFKAGYLSDPRPIRIVAEDETFVPAGIALSADGKKLVTVGCWGNKIAIVSTEQPEAAPTFISLDAKSHPYACKFSKDEKTLWVSCWGLSRLAQIDMQTNKLIRTVATEANPCEMHLSNNGKLLYVACSMTTRVQVIDVESGNVIETLHAALYPNAPKGNTPNSMSITPDESLLFIANADNNNLAVFNVSEPGRSKPVGFIPVGWYPTSVRYLANTKTLAVANGKGLGSKANPQGPNPTMKRAPESLEQYIARLLQGTVSMITLPSPTEQVAHTRNAYACSPLRSDMSPVLSPIRRPAAQQEQGTNPIPTKLGDPSPIEHCIYIVKENRTYDQVFGDMPNGNGDPNLCIFGENVTPNHHKLAREFVLLDNFYVDGEVSADGHQWTMGAYASDYVEKSWPLVYRSGGKKKIGYPAEGSGGKVAEDNRLFWDVCKEKNVSFFSFGEWIENGKGPNDPARARSKTLEGHFDPWFRSYDLDYPDVKRAERFISEYRRFAAEKTMPRFIVLRLPNDHTQGARPGKRTPTAYVADNDLALGMVVEAVSKSEYWPKTAIFVVEDDAQNGPDHVDAHRAVALVISPYCKRGSVDSTMYSTCSMLRTMELILGLNPMSQFDAAARPMHQSFSAKPDLKHFEHEPARVNVMQVNRADAWGADISLKMNLEREDAADDIKFNAVIWRSVKGANSPMPAPVRAAFFTPIKPKVDDDDDD